MTGNTAKASTAEERYAEIERRFQSGNLIEAQRLLDNLLDHPQGLSAEWISRFQIECGKVLLWEGMSGKSAMMLRLPVPSSLDREFTVRRLLLLAMAEVRLQLPRSAAREIRIAGALNPAGELSLELRAVQGSVFLEQGHPDRAQEYFQSSLNEAHRQHFAFLEAQIALNLGVVALQQQHYDNALELFGRAAAIAQAGGSNLLAVKALGNLGRTYYDVGDLARARHYVEEAEARARNSGAMLDDTNLVINAGLIQFAAHDPVSAKRSFERAVVLARSIGNVGLQLHARIALAYLDMQSQPEVAEGHIVEAERLARLLADPMEGAEARLLQALLLKRRHQFLKAEPILLDLVKRKGTVASFQWEAEITLAQSYDASGRSREAEVWYRRAVAAFHKQRLTLKTLEAELPFLENGSDLYMGYMEHLIRAGRTGEALRLLDASRAETLAEGLGTTPGRSGKAADARAVAARLRATVLVYCLRPERSYLWAITGTQAKFYTLPGSGAILPLLARHNQAILAAKDLLAQKDAAGRSLYDALLAPASGLLPKGGRVVLVADSALSRLNFETLIPPGEAPHYWIEDVSVTNARSLRLLAAGAEPRSMQKTRPKMLLIGDPVYAKGEYAPLPNAGTEMSAIAAHFAPAERVVTRGPEASPEAYSGNRPGRFRFVHFVAHATASELNPLDSAVILSSKATDGAAVGMNKLYASEILKQPLSAELVTLSSCYSSGTRNYTGEGVVGLAWAFLRAGAHSVIGALWEVSDSSTPKLMDTMYTRLLADAPPDAALRDAKLEMLRGGGVYRKPIYWAPFQLYAGR